LARLAGGLLVYQVDSYFFSIYNNFVYIDLFYDKGSDGMDSCDSHGRSRYRDGDMKKWLGAVISDETGSPFS
jgi:hypothetical protein